MNSTGRDLRRALFSLKQMFQDDKSLVHEFVQNDGLACLIKVGSEADQNYQNYILRGEKSFRELRSQILSDFYCFFSLFATKGQGTDWKVEGIVNVRFLSVSNIPNELYCYSRFNPLSPFLILFLVLNLHISCHSSFLFSPSSPTMKTLLPTPHHNNNATAATKPLTGHEPDNHSTDEWVKCTKQRSGK